MGEPMSTQRYKLRKQCNPRGPIGYILEPIHMQAASIDKEGTIWRYNKPPLQTIKAPRQQIAAMVAAMGTRNRTRAAADTCENLQEIDKEEAKGTSEKLEKMGC